MMSYENPENGQQQIPGEKSTNGNIPKEETNKKKPRVTDGGYNIRRKLWLQMQARKATRILARNLLRWQHENDQRDMSHFFQTRFPITSNCRPWFLKLREAHFRFRRFCFFSLFFFAPPILVSVTFCISTSFSSFSSFSFFSS